MKNTKPKERMWSVIPGLTAILHIAAIVGKNIAHNSATTCPHRKPPQSLRKREYKKKRTASTSGERSARRRQEKVLSYAAAGTASSSFSSLPSSWFTMAATVESDQTLSVVSIMSMTA